MEIEIQTYWNVETLYYVFNAVAAVLAGNGFNGMLKFVFTVAVAIGMFGYMNKQLEMAKWFIHALVFVTLLNLPIAKVIITDTANLEPPRTVSNVPFALAALAQATNLTFGYLTRTYETVFSVPDDLGLQKGDIGFGHRILKHVNNATVRDPGLRADLMQYFKECTLYDVRDGAISPQDIVGGVEVWQTIFNNTSPARFVTHGTLSATPTTMTCTDAALLLKVQVDTAATQGQTFYGKQAFTRATTDAIATDMFIASVGTSYNWILNSSQNSSAAMKQAMFNNIWREAGSELPTLLNDPARVAEVNAMTSAAQAARQADGSNSTLSLLAQETMPHMRNWIEAIIYALFPVVLVLMIVMTTEGAKKVFVGYTMTLAWISLWPLLFAIINHLSLMHLRYKLKALDMAAGVPFQVSDVFDATLGNEQTMIGYMVVLVPFIAGGIIKMGQGGFIGVADRMMTGFAAAGGAIGASTASGNMSMGQAGMDTASVNSTTMNKMDSNIGLTGGGASIGQHNGSTIKIAPNNNAVVDKFMGNTGTALNVDHRTEAGRNQDAQYSNMAGTGTQVNNRSGDSTTLTDNTGHDSTRGTHQQTGVQVGTTDQGGTGGSHSTGQTLGGSDRESSVFTTAAGANASGGMNLGVGVGNNGSGNATGGGIDPSEEKRIASAMRDGGASQEKIDEAVRNYRGSKGGSAGRVSPINAGINYSAEKTYNANQSRTRNVDTHHDTNEGASTENTYSETGSRTVQNGTDQQSNQTDRHVKDAALTKVNALEHTSDATRRTEYGTGERVNQSETNAFATHRDLMKDADLQAQVAKKNGMSPVRFAQLPTDRQMSMVQDFVSEKLIHQTTTMPTTTTSGRKLPTTPNDLDDNYAKNQAEIRADSKIQQNHAQNVQQTGFKSAAPIKVSTEAPPIVSSAKADVKGQLDPQNAASIPARATAHDENIKAWASPDKEVGAGRANPMAVVEDAEIRDVKDTGQKMWDKLTGGDGTADGEKLNDNQKRGTGSSLPINSDVTKK